MPKIKDQLKKEIADINQEIKSRLAGYIVAALGLVAGLAWNDAIKSLIEYIFPLKENSLTAKLIYAVTITCLVVLASLYILKIFQKNKISRKKEDLEKEI